LTALSPQLDYTVAFTSVHAGKYRTEDKLKHKNTDDTETKHNQNKLTTQNTAKQDYPGLVAF